MVDARPIGRWLLASLLLVAGCFEEPLVEEGADAGVPGQDAAGTLVDTNRGTDDKVDGGPTVTSCTVNEHCGGLREGLCSAPFICQNYVCVEDVTWVPSCETGDPCVLGFCDPATGACVQEDLCSCVMAEAPLACGSKVVWAASDPQPPMTEVDGQACGAPYGGGIKRVWMFTATTSDPVTIQSTGAAVASLSSLVSPQGDCEPAACMARSEKAISFQPAVGASYAIVVEHLDPIALESFELSVTCGAATSETNCNDQLDEDFDGYVDCLDPDCFGSGACPDQTETDCSNDEDDDANGLKDCADPACIFASACLQECESQLPASCGFHQGLTTGGGKANATDYVCGPAAPGKEVVYSFSTNVPKTVKVKSGAFAGGVYVMKSPPGQSDLCSPKYCETWNPTEATFDAQPFVQYYIAIDGPAGQDVSFNIEIECID